MKRLDPSSVGRGWKKIEEFESCQFLIHVLIPLMESGTFEAHVFRVNFANFDSTTESCGRRVFQDCFESISRNPGPFPNGIDHVLQAIGENIA